MNERFHVGQLVKVGPRYVMADDSPFIGRGRFEPDEWTGKTMRIVSLRPSIPASAELAPANIVDADESDAEVIIVLRRLEAIR